MSKKTHLLSFHDAEEEEDVPVKVQFKMKQDLAPPSSSQILLNSSKKYGNSKRNIVECNNTYSIAALEELRQAQKFAPPQSTSTTTVQEQLSSTSGFYALNTDGIVLSGDAAEEYERMMLGKDNNTSDRLPFERKMEEKSKLPMFEVKKSKREEITAAINTQEPIDFEWEETVVKRSKITSKAFGAALSNPRIPSSSGWHQQQISPLDIAEHLATEIDKCKENEINMSRQIEKLSSELLQSSEHNAQSKQGSSKLVDILSQILEMVNSEEENEFEGDDGLIEQCKTIVNDVKIFYEKSNQIAVITQSIGNRLSTLYTSDE